MTEEKHRTDKTNRELSGAFFSVLQSGVGIIQYDSSLQSIIRR